MRRSAAEKRMPAAARTVDMAGEAGRSDPLMVRSVEKAFRILKSFDAQRPTMSLAEVALAAGLDKSAAQRFTHTLTALGYLRKDPATKRFELSIKTLDLGFQFARANALAARAMPYLLHLSKETEETVNLTVLDDTEVVVLARFMSRHVLNTDVMVGTRMPAYCTASGVAMLACLPEDGIADILRRSELRPFTPATTWRPADVKAKVRRSAQQGYATAFEEIYRGDLSVAAAIVDTTGAPLGAINIAVTRARFTPEEAERRFAPMVVAAARAVGGPGG